MKVSSKSFYWWVRDLHMYFGLFIAPLVIVFAVSTIYLNHNLNRPPEDAELGPPVKIDLPQEGNPIQRSMIMQKQLGIPGEPGGVRNDPENHKVIFNYTLPGQRTRVHVDTETSMARLEVQRSGLAEAMIYLHIMPGPHKKPSSSGVKTWGWVADSFVYLMFFMTFTGIYLWVVLRAERKVGYLMLSLGTVTFFLMMIGLFTG